MAALVTWSTGAQFFHPEYGLKAGKLADAVRAAGPLLVDAAGQFWLYADGVWRPDHPVKGDVRRRVVRLLGERYRPAHLCFREYVRRSTSSRSRP
jgi:hypothetical protein